MWPFFFGQALAVYCAVIYLLHIETSTESCSVCISANGHIVAINETHQGFNHAANIAVQIQQCLLNANIQITQLAAVAVSKGPGSYTGLRVGVSTAKGLCYALGIPLIAVPTLHAMITGFVQQHPLLINDILVPMIDARRMEVYMALAMPHQEPTPAQAVILIANTFELYNQPIHLFGSGATKAKTLYENQQHINIHEGFLCSAAHMVKESLQRFQQKQFENVAYFEPYYLKEFVGTTPKNKSF